MPVDVENIWVGLYTQLTTASDFHTAFAGRVYYVEAPSHDLTHPYAVVSVVSNTPLRTFPKDGYEIVYQVAMFDDLDSGAQAASANGDLLRAQVDRQKWSATGQDQMTAGIVAERGPDRDGEAWRYDVDLSVMGYET